MQFDGVFVGAMEVWVESIKEEIVNQSVSYGISQ